MRRSVADRRAGPVAAQEGDVVAERQQLVRDRAQQRVVVAVGEVGAPDRAAEQHVADEREAAPPADEHEVAGACGPGSAGPRTRGSPTLEPRRPRLEPAVGQHVARVRVMPKRLPLPREPLEQEAVALIRALDRDRARRAARRPPVAACSSALLQRRGAAGVVDVAVGQEDASRPGPPACSIACRMRSTSPPGSITAAAPARLVPQEGAVLLEGRDGH